MLSLYPIISISIMKMRDVENRPAAAAAEKHQNRFVWKITPNLNGVPETL
jgi:hypothetical protein